MKNLSRAIAFKFIVSIAVAAVAIVAIRSFAQAPNPRPAPAERQLTLKFKDAELKDDAGTAFKNAVKNLKGDQFSLRLKHSNGSVEEVTPSIASIKIDKGTTSELAKSSDAEFTAIGTHVTQTITSANKAEIESVLATLK